MAQTAKSLRGNYIGSVVDNEKLSNTMLNMYKTPLADFKAQVKQWTTAERAALESLSDEKIASRQNNTIVVVSFGIWDLWNMIGKSYEDSINVVDHSIQVIMDQLNVLSQLWVINNLKVILTLTPDVTFLPAFKPTAAEQRVSHYKDTVKLTEYWNHKLRDAAEQWVQGAIYLFDTNAFVADLIKDWQLFAAGVEESNGLGKNQDPGWVNVEDACVQSGQQWVMATKEKQCENPDKYLFWNEMHLGPSAHRLMGTEVFHGIEEMWLRKSQGIGYSQIQPTAVQRPMAASRARYGRDRSHFSGLPPEAILLAAIWESDDDQVRNKFSFFDGARRQSPPDSRQSIMVETECSSQGGMSHAEGADFFSARFDLQH
ncbi:hypothetical protein KXW58_005931 [Aspergillus fumigatus]|nr:hypothetical protein KXW58_005931 [Aspergillus fumigatus]